MWHGYQAIKASFSKGTVKIPSLAD